MAQAQHRTLSKRVVDRLSVNGKDAVFWDRDLAGFGVRVYPSGKKVFVVQTRGVRPLEARDPRRAWRHHHRDSPQGCQRSHRPNQVGARRTGPSPSRQALATDTKRSAYHATSTIAQINTCIRSFSCCTAINSGVISITRHLKVQLV